jgi:hypothetical protein
MKALRTFARGGDEVRGSRTTKEAYYNYSRYHRAASGPTLVQHTR